MISDRSAPLRCLALLACGAPREAVDRAWAEAMTGEGGTRTIRSLAASLGLQGTLSRHVGRLPAEEAGPALWPLVAAGAHAERRAEAALGVVRALDAAMSPDDPPAVLFKGSALRVAGLYESGERDSVDADMVISPAANARFEAIYRAAGLRQDLDSEASYMSVVPADERPGSVDVHLALPGDASGDAGPPYDVVLALSSPVEPSAGLRHVRVLRGAAAREVAVHHFVRHHASAPANALRVLQDLSRLEGEGEAAPGSPLLPWRDATHIRAVSARLRRIAGEFRSGEIAEGGRAERFLEHLEQVLAVPRDEESEFAQRWGAMRGPWLSRAWFATKRAFGPGPETDLVGRVTRPARMAGRWAAARMTVLKKDESARVRAGWVGFLEAGA